MLNKVIVLLLLAVSLCADETISYWGKLSDYPDPFLTFGNYGYKTINELPDGQPYKSTRILIDRSGKYFIALITPKNVTEQGELDKFLIHGELDSNSDPDIDIIENRGNRSMTGIIHSEWLPSDFNVLSSTK